MFTKVEINTWNAVFSCEYLTELSEVKSLSRVQLFGTPWTVAYQAPLSIKFSQQEYWSGLPFPPPGDHPDPGTEPAPPALQAIPLLLSHWDFPYILMVNLAKCCEEVK